MAWSSSPRLRCMPRQESERQPQADNGRRAHIGGVEGSVLKTVCQVLLSYDSVTC